MTAAYAPNNYVQQQQQQYGDADKHQRVARHQERLLAEQDKAMHEEMMRPQTA